MNGGKFGDLVGHFCSRVFFLLRPLTSHFFIKKTFPRIEFSVSDFFVLFGGDYLNSEFLGGVPRSCGKS